MATHQWHLEVSKTAHEEIRGLSSKTRLTIFNAIRQLLESNNLQFMSGVKKLHGELKGYWRQRQGDYRIIFFIEAAPVVHMKHEYKGTIHIERVLHRREAYRK